MVLDGVCAFSVSLCLGGVFRNPTTETQKHKA